MATFNGTAKEVAEKQKVVLEAGKVSSVGGYVDLLDKLFGTSKALDETIAKEDADTKAKKANQGAAQQLAGTIGTAADQFQYYGDQLVRNGDGAKFLAGEFKVLKDGTIQLDNGARNARLGLTELGTSTGDLGAASSDTMVEVTGVKDSIAALPGAVAPANKEIFTMENSLINLGTAEEETAGSDGRRHHYCIRKAKNNGGLESDT